MTPLDEFHVKHGRLLDVLDDAGAPGLLLSSAGALSWLLGGARVHISLAGPPVVQAVVHREGVELAVFSNEAERLLTEELADLTGSELLHVHPLRWDADIDDVGTWLPADLASSADGLADEASAAVALRAARASLVEPEVDRYRQLCREAAEVLTEVLGHVQPNTSEQQLATALGSGLLARGADPVVLLAQGESRASHRHPLPTDAPLGRRAMAVVCARRHGLIANVTRWVRFGEPSAAELDREAAILQVEADTFDALAPGRPLQEVLEVIQQSYPRHGFTADEWTLHHQGGAAGYQGRDPRVFPGVRDQVHQDQPFAFNPTGFDALPGTDLGTGPGAGAGFKVEDTVLLRGTGENGIGAVEALSADPHWPTTEVRGRQRPTPLPR